MKSVHIRSFQIEHTTFHLTLGGNGKLYLTAIHPYDETEYHWAVMRTNTSWDVLRNGRRVTTLRHEHGTTYEPEAVARQLLNMDAAAHLKPTTAIW